MIDREDMEYLGTYIAECLSDMDATATTNVYGDEVKIPMKDFRLWMTLSQWGYHGEKAIRIGFRSSTDAALKDSLKIKSSEGGNWLVDQRKLRAKVFKVIAAAQEAHDAEMDRKQGKIDFKESLSKFSSIGEIRLGNMPEFEVDFPAGCVRLRKEEDGTYTFVTARLSGLWNTQVRLEDGNLARFVEACNALLNITTRF